MNDKKILMVTSSEMLEFDLDSRLLASQLAALKVESEIVVWDDINVDWSNAGIILLRTPWDYFCRPEEFLYWANKVSKHARMINPIEVINWNVHKSYLLDLQKYLVPIVPTQIIYKSPDTSSLTAITASAFDEIIIKPAISGGAVGLIKGRKDDPEVLAHASTLLKSHDILIQPFIDDITRNGEFSLIYFDGKFSHAIHKQAAPSEFRVQEKYGGTVHLYQPKAQELQVAQKALLHTPAKTTYARVDIAYYQNQPVIMELEVIEPELFLKDSLSGLENFARILTSVLEDKRS